MTLSALSHQNSSFIKRLIIIFQMLIVTLMRWWVDVQGKHREVVQKGQDEG